QRAIAAAGARKRCGRHHAGILAAGGIRHYPLGRLALMAPRFVLVAGEPSGDQLAAGLITALRRRFPDAVFEGVTGPQMEAAGCQPLAAADELGLFGLPDVLAELTRRHHHCALRLPHGLGLARRAHADDSPGGSCAARDLSIRATVLQAPWHRSALCRPSTG